MPKKSQVATAQVWRTVAQSGREARAAELLLPSGATILAARPEPLEWVMSGRIPQRLLAAALRGNGSGASDPESQISREEVLDLARFAGELVKASVVKPAIGERPDEISLDEIPIEDRAFIFQWACRALSQSPSSPVLAGAAAAEPTSSQEDLSSDKLEQFCAK